ncbi:pleckstrin homology domain-containing family G member 5-like isoform X2 [Periplaneta americana]|uniref:pleckstrin homology domain-containing family G member 5-like isoform X2 n=1 Tax=Periplaneta americana TaxID=6978 RepID=UPI0037E962BF
MPAFMTSSDPAVRDDFLRATMRIFLVVSPPMGRLQVVHRGRSRSLTHLDCLDPSDLTPDVIMTTDTADRLIVPCTEPPRVRRQKLARSQVSSSEYFSVSFECGTFATGGDDHSLPSEEFVPATKGTSLSDALKTVCARRGVDLSSVDVFLENSKTPLPVMTETSWLGGKQLRLRARDDRSPARGLVKPANSQVPLRKTSGSYRGSGGGRFFSASTEDPNYVTESSHEGSFKGSKGPKQRWSGLFGNSKDTKMESLVEQLNYYSKHGIPPLPQQQVEDENDEGLYILEDDWQAVVTSSAELNEKHRQQQTAIWELLSTEIAYIRTLKVITNLFLACLCNLQAANILNEVDKARLFSNIPDIYAANRHFWCSHLLPMLEESRKSGQPLNPQLLLDGFRRFQDVFLPYTKYCAEQAQCQHYCRERHQENEVFTAYLVWCETQKDCNRLRLMDIVVQPMQRLTKYSLLLKAIHRNTETEEHRESLSVMIKCVDQFVNDVNSTLRQRQDHERLKGIIARIESYDVVESKDDEVDRMLKTYSELDLTCPMPGCHVTQRRHLLLESDLKLKDNSTSKMDVHCFLLTDVLLVCKAATKKSGGSVKVIRQPYLVDRLIVQELQKDSQGIALVYLNEFRTATAGFILSSSEPKLIKSWIDSIKKAQELYAAAKQATSAATLAASSNIPITSAAGSISRQTSACYYEDDDILDTTECQSCASYGTNAGLIPTRSPRGGSSRGSRGSSLVHSHSGSMDMNEVSSVSSVSQSRGVSVENELRGSSLSSDEGIPALTTCSCNDGKTVSQQSAPTPSPRSDRRSLLSKSPSPNTLSVQVPVFSNLGQSLPNLNLATSPNTSHASTPNPPTSLLLVPPSGKSTATTTHHHGGLLSPGHRGVSYPPPSPPRGSLRRGFALTQSRNPPLLKTRHVNSSTVSSGAPTIPSPTQGHSPAASFDFDVPVIAGVSPPSEERVTPEPTENPSTGPVRSHPHRHAMMKRLTRTDNRRYHTAGAIDDIKKQDSRDASIHKRLSWNCGPGVQGTSSTNSELPASKCVSTESVQSSSGVSSTGSAHYSGSLVGDMDLLELDGPPLRVVCGNQLGCCFDTHLSTSGTSVTSPITDENESSACPPLSPAMEAINMELIRSRLSPGPTPPTDPGGVETVNAENVNETQEGATRIPPSKADILRMKDLILTDSSVEASQV